MLTENVLRMPKCFFMSVHNTSSDKMDRHISLCSLLISCACNHRRTRAVRPGTTIWRPCSAHLGLGLDRVFYHVGWACNERAFFQNSCVWGAVLLVTHAGRKAWALCKLACGLGQYAGAGKFLAFHCVILQSVSSAELFLCRLPLSVAIHTRLF